MKKLFGIVAAVSTLLLFTNLAFATIFSDIPTAEQHCPAISALLYAPHTQYMGVISGSKEGHNFYSYVTNPVPPHSNYDVIKPKSVDAQGMVIGASFRLTQLGETWGYGWTNGTNTWCYYSYPGIHGGYALIMQTLHIPS